MRPCCVAARVLWCTFFEDDRWEASRAAKPCRRAGALVCIFRSTVDCRESFLCCRSMLLHECFCMRSLKRWWMHRRNDCGESFPRCRAMLPYGRFGARCPKITAGGLLELTGYDVTRVLWRAFSEALVEQRRNGCGELALLVHVTARASWHAFFRAPLTVWRASRAVGSCRRARL